MTEHDVTALISAQFPQWRGRPVRRVTAQGTVNAVFRIGDGLAGRFPLQRADLGVARDRLDKEAEAAQELAGRTRFPTPEPVAIGEPGFGYPMPWSVQTWIPGVVATERDPARSVAFAVDLAEFIEGVRAIDTAGRTFSGGGRGGRLTAHDEWVQTCFRHSEHLLDVPPLCRAWAVMRELPRGDAPDVMTHGDLMPGNLLVADDRLAGVLDVGGLAPADPATDLVGAWHLLDDRPRQTLRRELGCDDLEWERGRAWAFEQSMGLVWYYHETNPVMSRTGRRTLERIMAES
ncbi:aminoglycoside phosphotransferase family protein [Actinoplanes sp. TRM 88003]|uniref:Aminoglycoside phosphotransferase family protein n=1 Tax=Paractinoplanes aksuensis TaxID=2939490 RepID=A0ABT1DS04_9ACTN|nr:phosphotransferase [Actinoplanes aksuensis]MCO8273298.1 aminoglycoside phosphotransferase family protein [Actinoplanes aksuensis]